MSIYYNKQIPGELWLRDLDNNVTAGNKVLSSIFLKYKNINETFYSELTSNKINKFDVIFDTIFIETNSGFIFEKFYIDGGAIVPFNQINFFNFRKNTTVDYWYSETKNKVFYTEIAYVIDPNKQPIDQYISFTLVFNSFDCTTGLSTPLLFKNIKIAYKSIENWDDNNFLLENPKITYNSDTKTFNISFILRNSINTFGLISINILDKDIPEMSKVTGFLPYLLLDVDNSSY
jgi:hypothetical protein